ncbi:hypothetical protein JCGZ_24359 [Jatropha curcas]|uniref:RNase H type-1 domain-containing protein n=1 Tax=Jatropha curcas TaxID=180498 RepID=A0A067LDL2_JATCU|nr:hypothetical protein JCGZ_24358 [Jatropha curcas]KDP42585.1 hypothetical protein JCGZ_24359 [Jatropha curcas]
MVKCNINAAVYNGGEGAGFGAILRDAQGQFVAGITGRLLGISQPRFAESSWAS